MARLGIVTRVGLAISGAWRRFADDPARGRAALERAVPRLRPSPTDDPLERFDRAVARDRWEEARDALAELAADDPARPSAELAFDVLGGRLSGPALARPRDARGRRAVRAAHRQSVRFGPPTFAMSETHHAPRAGGRRDSDGDDRPRVLHVVTNSLPLTQAGSTIRTQSVVRAQRDLGWDAHVVTRPGYPVTHGDLRSAEVQFVDGVPYHRLLPAVMPSDDRLGAAYVRWLERLVDELQPRVIHAASDHVNARAALEVGRRRGLPVAYEARSFFEDTWLARHGGEVARTSELYALMRERHTEVLLAADVVTTLGIGMREEIIARGVHPDRVVVTPNAVSLDFLDPRDQQASRQRLGLDDGLWFGSVATVHDEEDLGVLVEAVAILRRGGLDARVLVAGDGPGLASLRRRAREAEVPLTAPGRVPFAKVRDWYDALDVFAIPRRDTALNRRVTALKPVEAQARGIPVVGSDLPAVVEVLAPCSTVTPAGDAGGLASALARFADPVIRSEAGERAREWVVRTRTWPAVMSAYRDAYASVGVPFP